MDECCGQFRESRFCPDCGRELDGNLIYVLLTHVARCAVREKEILDNYLTCDPCRPEKMVKLERSVIKWAEWERALRELIEAKVHETPAPSP